MRINVYTEELTPEAEIVHADYTSVKTNQPMRNYGLRIFLKSAPELHYVPPRDDDRSAVTFWCGPSVDNVFALLEQIKQNISTAPVS